MHWESRRCVFKKSIPWWNQGSMKRHYCCEGVNESQTASIEEKRKLPSSWLILLRIIRHLTGKDYNPSIGCRLPTSGKSAASCHPAFAGNAVCQWAAFEIMLKCLTHCHVQDCICYTVKQEIFVNIHRHFRGRKFCKLHYSHARNCREGKGLGNLPLSLSLFKATTGGSVKLIFTMLKNLVSLKQSHHKPVVI